jgi:RNA polymerase sigma-32 factor
MSVVEGQMSSGKGMVREENYEESHLEDPSEGDGDVLHHLVAPKEAEDAETVFLVEPEEDRTDLARYDPLRYYLLEISKFEPLSFEEEQQLARLYQEKQDLNAARQLVTSNLKLVVRIAFLYNKIYSNLMDLIQEGNIGLLHAVKKFDPDRGTRLPTYASWWIKAYIIKFILDNFRIVKVGTTNDRRKILMNLRRERQRLEVQGIAPTSQRIAEALNVSEEDVVAVENSIQSHDISLDQKISDDSDILLLDTLASTEQLIEERMAAGELKEIVNQKFREFASTLSEKETTILRDRLLAEDPLTLQAIANKYHVTREAIRVTEKKLTQKIKTYMKKALSGFGDIDFRLAD